MAPETGPTGGSSAILANDGMVGGPGTVALVPPPPAQLHEVAHSWLPPRRVLPERCGYTTAWTPVTGHRAPANAGPC